MEDDHYHYSYQKVSRWKHFGTVHLIPRFLSAKEEKHLYLEMFLLIRSAGHSAGEDDADSSSWL